MVRADRALDGLCRPAAGDGSPGHRRQPAGDDLAAVTADVRERGITSFISRLSVPPPILVEQHNRLQEIAEGTRLAIPLTISTDPRHHFQVVLGASAEGDGFSTWPELPVICYLLIAVYGWTAARPVAG